MEVVMANGRKKSVEREVGAELIANGLAIELKKEDQRPAQKFVMQWHAVPGNRVDDFQYPPLIFASCACGVKGCTSSWKGTAHETAHRHCGHVLELPPADVVATYLELYARWRSRSKSEPRPPRNGVISAAAVHTVTGPDKQITRSFSPNELQNYRPASAKG